METQVPKSENEISFYQAIKNVSALIKHIISKWRILLIIAIIGAAVGVGYAWIKKVKYKAVLTFSTDASSSPSGGLAGIASQFGFNIGGSGKSAFTGDNLMVLIESHKIILSSLFEPDTINGKPTNLLNYYIESFPTKNKNDGPAISFPLNQDPKTFNRQQDSVLNGICAQLLKNVITASRIDKKLDIFQIECVSQDEVFSQKLSQQLIKQVSIFYTETQTKQARLTVDILQKRADSIRNAYNNALVGRANLSDENLNPAFQGPMVSVAKKQTDVTVLGTAYGEIIKNLELAKFNLLQRTPLIQVIDEPVLPLLKIKSGRLLSGIIFAFVFCLLAIFYLSFKYYLRLLQAKEEKKSANN